MTLDPSSLRDVVCIAGGTGLAPIKGLVQELAKHNRNRWVHVFVGAKDREDLYDLSALYILAAKHPWLTIIPACSEDAAFAGEKGNVADVAARYGPWIDHDFFVSGPPSMVRFTLRILSEMQVPPIRIKHDALRDDHW
jgi:NAD(P)H-flavin reductase